MSTQTSSKSDVVSVPDVGLKTSQYEAGNSKLTCTHCCDKGCSCPAQSVLLKPVRTRRKSAWLLLSIPEYNTCTDRSRSSQGPQDKVTEQLGQGHRGSKSGRAYCRISRSKARQFQVKDNFFLTLFWITLLNN